MIRRPAHVFVVALLCLGFVSIIRAQVTYSGTSDNDSFLATGSPSNPAGTDLTDLNYGAAGILAISPASAPKGEFQSVAMFNVAGAVSLFNSTYGTNGWTISGISLTLASNYGTNGEQPDNLIFNVISGGNFVIEWLSDDNWVEGTGTPRGGTMDGVTYDSLPALLSGAHDILCTNNYTPPGDFVPITYSLPLDTNLVANVAGGGEVSLLFYAADNQIGYLFNSHNYGGTDEPLINVTAVPFFTILTGYFTNGDFHLVGAGGENMNYQVQASTNLSTSTWQTLGTVTADGSGSIQFDDTGATNQQCFYRLSQ